MFFFSYTEGSTVDSFRLSDFDQSVGYRIEDAVALSGSKYSFVEDSALLTGIVYIIQARATTLNSMSNMTGVC